MSDTKPGDLPAFPLCGTVYPGAEAMSEAVNEYWDSFVPSLNATELGDAKDSDPRLADAWLGWQQARRVDAQRIAQLEAALRDVMPLLDECDCIYSDREAPLCPCRAARAAILDASRQRVCK